MPSEASRFYFIGIGGIGMAAVAGYLRQLGKIVSGADSELYPPSCDILKKYGIPYQEEFSAEHLVAFRPDICVVGSIVARQTNVQLDKARELAIPLKSFPEVIEEYIARDLRQVVVTGTHGKTTTSALIAEGLNACRLKAGFIIGGEAIAAGTSFQYCLEASLIVIEGDEYITSSWDPSAKFLHYSPELLVINNVEWDHIDAYPSFTLLLQQFERLFARLPPGAQVVANWDDAVVRRLCEETGVQRLTYGTAATPSVDYLIDAASAVHSERGMEFQLARLKPAGEEFRVKVETSLNGRFNLMNATAAFAALQSLGAEIPDILSFLKGFQKVRRRLELIYRDDSACVYDDFAHHPTAVRVTLEALRACARPGDVLVAIFEPASSSSRRKEFEDWYAGSFSAADLVLIAPVKRDARIELLQQLDSSSLAGRIGPKADSCASYEEILNRLKSLPAGRYQFVFLSSGRFGGLPLQLADFLARRPADAPGAPRLLSPK